MTELAPALDWVARVLGSPVVSTSSIAIATTSEVVIVRTATQSAVLKRYTDAAILAEEPDAVAREATLLDLLPATFPAPRLLAIDEDGSQSGVPSILMTELAGAMHPSVPDPAALAVALASLHDLDASVPWRYRRYTADDELCPPSWCDPSQWDESVDVVTSPPPASPEGLIQRDVHPANLLWDGDRLSGIIDWMAACRGPRAIDLAHLRVNLALAGGDGDEVASTVIDRYQEQAGELVRHPYWEVVDAIDLLPCDRGQQAVDAWPGEQPWWPGDDVTLRARFAAYLTRALDEIG